MRYTQQKIHIQNATIQRYIQYMQFMYIVFLGPGPGPVSNNFWAVPKRRKRGKDRKTSMEAIFAKFKQACAT